MKCNVEGQLRKLGRTSLDGFRSLDGKALKERWRILYGTEPPGRVSTPLLVQVITYRLQEKTLGVL